jgi:hypothetical protein
MSDESAAQSETQLPLTGDELKAAISRELYRSMEKLGADPQLLALVGSYGDTLHGEAACLPEGMQRHGDLLAGRRLRAVTG